MTMIAQRRGRLLVAVLAAVFGLAVAGCQESGSPSGSGPAATGAGGLEVLKGRTITVSYPSALDFGNAHYPMIGQAFEQHGAKFEPKFFANQQAANSALLSGQVDFQQNNLNTVVLANLAGADLRVLANMKANEWTLLTSSSITSPEQLDGKRIGIHGPGTVTELLVNSTIKKYGIEPRVVVVPGSDARAQALMQGQLDVTPAELRDVLNVQRLQPGKFHTIVDYSKDLPFLGSMLTTRKQLIDEDAAFVSAVVTVWTQAVRQYPSQEAQLKQAITSTLPDLQPEQIDSTIKAYQAINYWDPTLTAEKVSAGIQFMVDSGSLKPDQAPSVDSIADLSFIQKAGGG
jgi:NitT/TauT family transport system substrate-binding protein